MVIIRLTGGLGNQMFQYATGRAAALRNQTNLLLDTSFYESTIGKLKHEEISLDLFPEIKKLDLRNINNIKVSLMEDKSKRFFIRKYDRLLNLIGLPISFKRVEEEIILNYQENFIENKARILYFASDWQNENYFKDYESTIRNDFSFPELDSNSFNSFLLNLERTTNSVAIHVRRGDYLTSAIHTPISTEYYNLAIKAICKRVAKPIFFVFSDDIKWCRQTLKLPETSQFINHNNEKYSYIDMQLMSNCRHNIIANSSFSWWGAWLNKNPNKIVISPKIWLEKINIDARKIVPNQWITI